MKGDWVVEEGWVLDSGQKERVGQRVFNLESVKQAFKWLKYLK